MKKITENQKFGTIIYDESFWTGKKIISVNGIALSQKDKKTFIYSNGDETKTVGVDGSYLSGVKLSIDGEEIPVVPAPQWYEVLCSVLIFLFVCVWGNNVVLCSIIPMLGGAIGGAISGAMAIANLCLMKSRDSIAKKLVVWLGLFAATVLICVVGGFLLVAALM